MSIQAFTLPVFQPAMRIITAITNANIALVTTSFDNSYLSGTIVRFDIPKGFGMQQLNQQTVPITVVNTTQFTIPIDTTFYDIFMVPIGNEQYAQVVPLGELSGQLNAALVNALPYQALP